MKTAVEWYAAQAMQLEIQRGKGIISISQMLNELSNIFQQAKEMEKQQISKAFFEGRLKEIGSGVLFDLQPLTETFYNYYNETFKSE